MIFIQVFFSNFSFSQVTYDDCGQALEICPNNSFSINNIGATKTACNNCDDNFTFCFTPNNTIWLKFTSNDLGGNAQLDFSNLVFQTNPNQDNEIQATIIKALAPCDATTYTTIGNCVANATTNFSLSANLSPSTLYYVVINGAKNGAGITKAAELTVDVILSGVGVDRIPPSIFINGPDSLCIDELATYQAISSNCPESSTFQWFINGQLIAVTQNSFLQTTALRNEDTLSVSNSCYTECPILQTALFEPIFVETFFVDAGEDQFISPNETALLNGNTDVDTFFWSPNNQISNINLINPAVSPEFTTSYFLTGQKNGCFLSDEVVITVDLNLKITNSFTPNEDGFNDSWEIPGLIEYPNCLVQIFNRWGQLVFTSTGYNEKKAWNGKINGKLADASVYYYTIDLRNGNDDLIKGSVTLIK
ncbi:MAG: gliding motility-associated C-terminal domain-containing protein [Bacteroidota bacterium]